METIQVIGLKDLPIFTQEPTLDNIIPIYEIARIVNATRREFTLEEYVGVIGRSTSSGTVYISHGYSGMRMGNNLFANSITRRSVEGIVEYEIITPPTSNPELKNKRRI